MRTQNNNALLQKQIKSFIESGMSLYEAASEIGIRTDVASELLEKELKKEKKRKEAELRNKIISLHEEGKNAVEIGSETGELNGNVQRVIDKAQYMKQIYNTDSFFAAVEKQNEDTAYHQLIKTDYNNGLTVRDLALKYHFKQKQIKSILKRQGIIIGKAGKSGYVKKSSSSAAERHATIIRLYKEGKSVHEIGETLNIYWGTARNILLDYGVIVRKEDKLKKLYDEIADHFRNGLSREELIEKYGVNDSEFRKQMKRRGFAFAADDRVPLYIEAYKSGKTTHEIAAQFNLTEPVVRKHLKKAKLFVNHIKKRAQQITVLYNEGKNIEDIAKTVDLNPASVLKNLVNQKLLTTSEAFGLKRKCIREQLKKGESVEFLCKRYNTRPVEVECIRDRTSYSVSEAEERDKMIVKLFLKGTEVKKIAKKVKITVGRTWYILNQNIDMDAHRAKIQKQRDDKIIALFHEGKSAMEISRCIGMTKQPVMEILHRNNLYFRERTALERKEKNKELTGRFTQGKSRAKIAEELNLDIKTVRRVLHQEGFNEKHIKAERDQQVCQLFKDGTSIENLAGQFKITVMNVRSILRRKKINPRMHYAEQRRLKMVAAWQQGKTIKMIADEVGLTEKVVQSNLLKKGISRKKMQQQAREDFKERVRQMHLEGKTREEISTITGRPFDTIRNIFTALGINPKAIALAKRNQEIVRLYRDGVLRENIAAQFGIQMLHVNKILNDNGISFRQERARKRKQSASYKQVVQYYMEGKTIDEIRQLCNTKRGYVSRILRTEGIFVEEKRIGRNEQEILRLTAEGVRVEKIAKQLNLSKGTVLKYLRNNGTTWRGQQSEKRNRQIADEWRSGKTFEQLMRDWNLGNAAVRNALNKCGIYPGREETNKKYNRMYELHTQGLAKEEIAALLKTTPALVSKALAQKGIRINKAQEKYKNRSQEIIRLYKEGKRWREIAAATGLKSRGAVQKALLRNGISDKEAMYENNEKRNQQIKELFLSGMEKNVIARQFGLTKGVVGALLRKMGVKTRQVIKQRIDSRNQRIAAEFKKGKSPEDLSKKYRISLKQVNNILGWLKARIET